MKACTAKQGQYLAFIFYYTKVHRVAPAETDMQGVPRQARSIRLLIPREALPELG